MRRALRILGFALGLVVLAAIIGVLIISNTDVGRERVRQFALSTLRDQVHGTVQIGRVSGNLLSGIRLHDVAIHDAEGHPFLVAEELHARYAITGFLLGRIRLSDVELVRPLIVLDRPPEGQWNYARIFAGDTLAAPDPDPRSRWQLIVLEDVTITQGRITVRLPWSPDDRLGPAQRDSAAAAAVAGEGRANVIRVAGGHQQVMDFRDLDARLPELRLVHPEHEGLRVAVDTLRVTAEVFRPPAAEITHMVGAFEIGADSLHWRGNVVHLPGSVISGDGSYTFDEGDIVLDLRGEPVALADLRWLYPRLPAEGGGRLLFQMVRRGDSSVYIARQADLTVADSRLAGDFGLVLAEEVAFRDTDLRMARFDTRLIEQLVPDLELPRRGWLGGRVRVAGPLRNMRLDANVVFDDVTGERASAHAVGGVGVGAPRGALRAAALRVQLHALPLALVDAFMEGDLPVGGVLSGSAVLDGSTTTTLRATADITHVEQGARSRVSGDGTVRFGRDLWLDIDARARPVSLVTLGRMTPVKLRGAAAGPIRLTGTMRDLRLDARFAVTDGGTLAIAGTLNAAAAEPTYAVGLEAELFDVGAILVDGPSTSLTASARAEGRGTDPATMQARLTADVSTSLWNEVSVDSATVRLAVGEGMLHVDSLRVRAPATEVDAWGTLGLVAAREGELRYRVRIDSLAAFTHWLPRDTGYVEPSAAAVARAREAARADSARIAAETEVERAIAGAPPPRLEVEAPPAIPRDSIAGAVFAAGVMRGNLERFDLHGRAGTVGLLVAGHAVEAARAEYRLLDVPSPDARVIVAAEAAELSTSGFSFDSVGVRVDHRTGTGTVAFVVRQGDDEEYGGEARYALSLERNELHIGALQLRFDTTTWAATHPAVISWSTAGVEIDSLELRSGDVGRIFVDGRIPTEGSADLTVQMDAFEIGHVAALLQLEPPLTGLLSLSGKMTGTLAQPRLEGAAGLLRGAMGGTRLPDLNASFRYADRELASRVVATRDGGTPLAVAEGTLPIDLALADAPPSRLPDGEVRLDLVADSLPLDVLPQLTEAVFDVRGRVIGEVAMRGPVRNPNFTGALAVDLGSFGVAPLGIRVIDLVGHVRLAPDTIVIDSLVGFSRGRIRLAGGLGVSEWTTPSFDMSFTAQNARVLDNDLGRLMADGELVMRGPFERTVISGRATIRQGVIYPPPPDSREVISARDPAVFDIIDTSLVDFEGLIPEENPFMANLRMDVDLTVARGTWVRTAEANVEVHGDLQIRLDQRRRAVGVTGSVNTDRGEYTFFSRRFQVVRGSATFIGSPEINPTLQITALHEVPIQGREALNIRVIIGGTLSSPKLTLESDAQPPIPQSQLLQYLAFGGRAGQGSVLQSGSGTGATAGGDLVGAGAEMAGQRLAGMALGVALSELEGEASRNLGLDVLHITPSQAQHLFGSPLRFFQQTEIEAGRYVTPDIFVAVQGTGVGAGLGARAEYRLGGGYRLEGEWVPRILTPLPTLGDPDLRTIQSVGLFLIREWRFSSPSLRRPPRQPQVPVDAELPGEERPLVEQQQPPPPR